MIEQTRVLVVDDDAPMVDLLVAVLRDAGLRAVPALGGQAAIELFEDEPDALSTFDVVLTDQNMPDVSGTELAAWLNQHHGPPVLLMSGGADLGGDLEVEVLTKPFPLDMLIQRIRCLADAARRDR